LKTIYLLAALALLVSAAIGGYILATDTILWQDAPMHADGLIAFVVLDLALILGLRWKPRLATIGITLLALIQLGAMGADAFIGQSVGTTISSQSFLQKHLLGDAAFMFLLGVQALLIVIGIAAIITGRRSSAVTSPVTLPKPGA